MPSPEDNEFRSPTCAAPAYWYTNEWETDGPKIGWYFFYGTLTRPSILAEVIGSEEKPVLHRAKIFGYKMMMWGPCPALIRDEGNAVIEGSAFKVENEAEAQCLQRYETSAYAPKSCRIHFENEAEQKDAAGWTFVWHRSLSELSEGQFNIQSFQRANPN